MPTLKELRLSRRLTLLAVSKETGISFSALNKYENGMTTINAKNKKKLEEYFGEEFTTIPPLTYRNYKQTLETLDAAKQLIKVLNNRVTYYENFVNTLHEDLSLMLQDMRPLGK